MESEIVDEIPECSIASLHTDGTERGLNKNDELLKDNFSKKELNSIEVVVDVQGQVVPAHSPSCLKPETAANHNNEHLTVPQGNAMKTFLWPPIGFKDQVKEHRAPSSEPDTLKQVVLQRNNENNVINTPELVPIIKNVNQSEEHSSQEEKNTTLTSILKKNDSGLKKTVHFPKNIVSVKFYDISDEEDSDNDTVILSDPEEDDLRDQEVPFNTYDDYDPNCFRLVSTSSNFTPQFTFPPILKIANCHLYENIDDHDEQIMAIMEDDDGRERLYTNDYAADEIYYQKDISGYQDDVSAFQEIITQSENDVFPEVGEIVSSANPTEEPLERMETQELIIKDGIEQHEDNLEMKDHRNMKETFEVESLDVNQQTLTKDKTAKEKLDVIENEMKPQNTNETNEHQIEQPTFNKIKTIFQSPEEMEQHVNKKNTDEYEDDKLTLNEIKSFENLTEDKEIIEVQTLTMQNEVGLLEEDSEINEQIESESSVVKENFSELPACNEGIENPAMIHMNSSDVNNETNNKVSEVNELDVKVYTLLDALKAEPSNSVEVTKEERLTEESFVQQTAMASMILLPESETPEFPVQRMQTELTRPDMVKEWLIATQNAVSHDETSTMADASFGRTDNVDSLPTNTTRPSKENMIKKQEVADVLQNVSPESKENSFNSFMETTRCSDRAVHGNCGSNFLWRGSRSINNMILDEKFQVPAAGSIEKGDIPYSLAKEEITFSRAAIIDVRSLESNIVAAVWNDNAGTSKHCCHEEVKLEKYDHSFLSSPDHLNEFEELEESVSETDFPNKKQRMENHASSNTGLKHSNFNHDNGESVETGFHEHHMAKSHFATTLKHFDQGDTPNHPEYATVKDVHVCDGTTQIVPDMSVQAHLKTQPMKESPRAVPCSVDDIVAMDTTSSSLHLDSLAEQSLGPRKQHELAKEDSIPGDQGLPTSMLATQGRRKLRVGLSKSTRVKPLHPYWSKERIKQNSSLS